MILNHLIVAAKWIWEKVQNKRMTSEYRLILHATQAAVVVLLFYFLSIFVSPGIFSWAISTLFLTLILVTCFVRANDISKKDVSGHWQIRRLGFLMAGAASMSLIVYPVVFASDWPTWKEVLLRAGFCFILLTSPHLPPWWVYVSGDFSREKAKKKLERVQAAEKAAFDKNVDP